MIIPVKGNLQITKEQSFSISQWIIYLHYLCREVMCEKGGEFAKSDLFFTVQIGLISPPHLISECNLEIASIKLERFKNIYIFLSLVLFVGLKCCVFFTSRFRFKSCKSSEQRKLIYLISGSIKNKGYLIYLMSFSDLASSKRFFFLQNVNGSICALCT